MTDSELVEQASRGDTEAFGQLVERHRGAVYRAALAAIGSPEEAEEAAQDAFVTAFRKLEGFRGDASFKTWLLTITWRHALDRRKALSFRLRRFVGRDADDWPNPPVAQSSQEQRLLDAELSAQVRVLVRKLPDKLRDPLLLLASGEYSYKEMAQVLGVPSGTLKWRVMEARRQLREKLGRLGYVEAVTDE